MPAPYTVMGILDVTPASPEALSEPFDADAAIRRGLALADAGAGIVDVGAEATRPLLHDVPARAELARVLPVIEGLVAERPDLVVSIDTTKAEVAAAALAAGATYVNDISAGRHDADMLPVIAAHGASCCLMHMRGTPRTMQGHTRYDDVVDDVRWFLERRVDRAVAAGIPVERIDVDPGLGFSKTPRQDLELLRRLGAFAAFGPRVLIGTSNKSFQASLTRRDEEAQRIGASVATSVLAMQAGARVFRAHEVGPVRDALALAAFVVEEPVAAPAAPAPVPAPRRRGTLLRS